MTAEGDATPNGGGKAHSCDEVAPPRGGTNEGGLRWVISAQDPGANLLKPRRFLPLG